jgi:hypothetical protein
MSSAPAVKIKETELEVTEHVVAVHIPFITRWQNMHMEKR